MTSQTCLTGVLKPTFFYNFRFDHLGEYFVSTKARASILPPKARSVQNEIPGTFWKPLGQRRLEVFKMRFPEHSGSHLATGGQNSSTSAFKRHLGATWPTEARTQVRVLALVVQRPTNGLQPTCFRFLTCESRQPPVKEKSWSFKACGVRKSHTTRGQKCSK